MRRKRRLAVVVALIALLTTAAAAAFVQGRDTSEASDRLTLQKRAERAGSWPLWGFRQWPCTT
ncbi:MAG: hypothetical protein H0T61_00460 [Actinobacteria bacterium]|nr:hypothetical protein [Actinomycetota bacterium]